MSDKSYSNCPLKKRPVQVVDHVESDAEDEDDQPVDLSAPRGFRQYASEERLSDLELPSPSFQLSESDGELPRPLGLSKFAYPADVSYMLKLDDSRISPASVRESSVSPPVFQVNSHLRYAQPYQQLFLNHNNNVVKEEHYQNDHRSMISPASSHLSYSSVHSDIAISSYSEPEDLSVRAVTKSVFPVNPRSDLQRTRRDLGDRQESYYQCAICKKCYSTAAGLMKHEQCHSLPQDLSKTKSIESSVIVRNDRVVSPKEQHSKPHSAPRYQCPDCGKSYSTYSGLTKHQQFHCPAAEGNQAKKFFSCKNCDKVYVSLGALKMHIRTHTLPCKCPLCGKAFSRPWLLQGHIRTHTGEKPFSCQHCHRAFADRSNLRAHLQTHSDVKKYSCSTCAKTFSRMSLLGKHLQGGCPAGNAIPPHPNGMTQINCDYTAVDHSIYYKSNMTSYPSLREGEYGMHQDYSSGNNQHYKGDVHVF